MKCPYKYREASLSKGISKNHDYIIIADSDGNIIVNKHHEYYQQIQGQLALTERQFCYLVVWTPNEVITIRIPHEDYSTNLQVLQEFYLNHYVKFISGEAHCIV